MKIPLTQGKVAIVDDDCDIVRGMKWSYHNKGYAWAHPKHNVYVLMHHLILGRPKPGYEVDHINRDRLDNRMCNLRFVTRTGNMQNRSPNKDKQLPQGVSRHGEGFRARINVNKTTVQLGTYVSPEEASKAYTRAKGELFPK